MSIIESNKTCLEDDEKELKKTIAKFEKDELEHHDIGLEHDAENAPGYKVMTKVIEIGCKAAIAISKKSNFLIQYPNTSNLANYHVNSLEEVASIVLQLYRVWLNRFF